MAISKERRAFLKEQCRLFAAGVIENIEVIASGRFDHLEFSGEEMEALENEKLAIAYRILSARKSPAPSQEGTP